MHWRAKVAGFTLVTKETPRLTEGSLFMSYSSVDLLLEANQQRCASRATVVANSHDTVVARGKAVSRAYQEGNQPAGVSVSGAEAGLGTVRPPERNHYPLSVGETGTVYRCAQRAFIDGARAQRDAGIQRRTLRTGGTGSAGSTTGAVSACRTNRALGTGRAG